MLRTIYPVLLIAGACFFGYQVYVGAEFILKVRKRLKENPRAQSEHGFPDGEEW